MSSQSYEDKIEGNRRRGVEKSLTGRDIARDYPPRGDMATRAACERDLRLFCETYFPNAFNLQWSEDHLKVIARMEEVILRGGLFALAMPRGSGKSTLSMRAALWALLYGHRRFVSLIGATEDKAKELLKALKVELNFNDRLGADFRQVCYPIRRLENNGRKCIGQLFEGKQTRIEWSDDRLAFPTMPDSACDGVNVSGYTVSVAGLTGALRGQSTTLASGVIIRPEVAILDDPQTRESAMSVGQSVTRAAIIKGDVLGMPGPGKGIAAIMPCTVIRTGDMADSLLDRKKNPEWSGQLTKMVYSFPSDEKLWEEYGQLWEEGYRAERGTADATAFYAANRDAMDAGSRVAWPARYEPNELSALQHAMNLKLRDAAAFFAEYQNEPLPPENTLADDLTPDQICGRVNRIVRTLVPTACSRITAFVDVQASLLYYLVCAWEDDFTGYVIDYGSFPDQKRPYFTLNDAKNTLSGVFKTAGLEGRLYGGLEALTNALLSREWQRDDGAALKIERCLIDANWGTSTAVVKQFCRQSAHSTVLTPSHGKYVGASGTPMAEWPKRPGERAGLNWRLRAMEGAKAVRSVVFDTNWWKSFLLARLSTAMGDRGCLSLFGSKPETHRLLADHLCSEYRVRTEGRGRVLDEWKWRPERPDNHWLDCLTGACVAASMSGVTLVETRDSAPAKRVRTSFKELQAKRRGHVPPPNPSP